MSCTGFCTVDRSANEEDGARLDVVAESFWGDWQRAFFDVRVFNPFAQSYRTTSLTQCYKRNEMEKRRAYDEREKRLSTDLLNLWWHGHNCNRRIQKDRLDVSRKAGETLQQDHPLGPMQPQFFSSSDPQSCAFVGPAQHYTTQLAPLPVRKGRSQDLKFP